MRTRIDARIACAIGVLALLAAPSPVQSACRDRLANGQPRFLLNGDDVLDRKSGLTWKRCSAGLSWDGHRCTGTARTVALDDAQRAARVAGRGWRVPSGPELGTLVDRRCGTPTIDTAVFPDVRLGSEGQTQYWTTTPVGAADLYYDIDFADGRADGHSRGFPLRVRFVKTP